MTELCHTGKNQIEVVMPADFENTETLHCIDDVT
jgi:hypothetical protein